MRSSVTTFLLAAIAIQVTAQGPETTAPAQLGAVGIGLQGNGTNATDDGKYTISAEGIRYDGTPTLECSPSKKLT